MSKAKLIAQAGSAQGSTFLLDQGTQWIIGRDPEQSSIAVEDSHTSRVHAKISLQEQQFIIENLSSTNPLKVNQQDITTPTALKEGDQIKIGSNLFLFTTKEASELPPPSLPSHQFDTLFSEQDPHTPVVTIDFDFLDEGRWLFKVLTGPNQGAEIYLEEDHDYIIGKDESKAEIILQDLSVSHQHASIKISSKSDHTLKDLGSRNGTFLDGKPVKGSQNFKSHQVIALGTTTFLIIDKQAPQQTVIAPNAAAAMAQKEEAFASMTIEKQQELEAEKKKSEEAQEKTTVLTKELSVAKEQRKKALKFAFIIAGVVVFFSWTVISLFSSHDVSPPKIEYEQEIGLYLRDYTEVSFKFNKATGQIFLLGHVLTQEEHNELIYNLKKLPFILEFNDHIVIDEGVWQEMNQILGKNDKWRGISIYTPQVGRFAVSGYLKTRKEFEELNTFVNLNFNYEVENKVVVEENLSNKISGQLLQNGFLEVSFDISNGDLTLTGFVATKNKDSFNELLQSFKKLEGVRSVKNFVVELALDESRLDLSTKYAISGYTRKENKLSNVIINGNILAIGDSIDGMMITDILPKTVYLEKSGVKYKIDYNP